MNLYRLLTAKAAFSLILFLVFVSLFGEGLCNGLSSTVYIEPAVSYIRPEQCCTLSVMVDDAVDSLSCVFCVVAFDSNVVECIDAEEGLLYESSSYSTFFNWFFVAPDSVRLEDCVLGYRSFILAPGELYRIVFKGIDVGTSRVKIAGAEVYDIDRDVVPVETGAAVEISVSTTAGMERVPSAGSLCNYPNPFNPSTTLIFFPPGGTGGVGNMTSELLICSPHGGVVRYLYSGYLREGRNEFSWNGKNDEGRDVSSGVYMAVLRSPVGTYRRKIVLLR